MRDRGAVLIEFALIAPLMFLLIFGSITLGIGQYRQMELRTTAQQAVDLWMIGALSEAEAVAYAAQNGNVVCASDSHDGCFVSGLPGTIPMRQLIVVGETLHFIGNLSVTPGAKVIGT